MAVFIQWNARGLQANREELSVLIHDFKADIICLQETNLALKSDIGFKNYDFYHCSGTEVNGRYHGG